MDDLEQQLTAVLADEADHVEVPPHDLDGLLLAGRREVHRGRARTVRFSVAGVAAGALLVTGVGLAVHGTSGSGVPHHDSGIATHPSTRPSTLADLPRGTAPAIPYWLHGSLHIGTHRIQMPQPSIVSAGGSTLVVRETNTLRSISLVEGTRLVALQTATTEPVISPDGRYAAWEAPSGSALTRLVLWRLDTGKQVVSHDFHSKARCCDAPSYPVGVDEHGKVFVWDGGHALVWNYQDATLQEITGIDGSGLVDADAAGPVFAESARSADAGNRGWSVYGLVVPTHDQSAHFGRVATFPSQQGSWSTASYPGGSVAYISPDRRPFVLDTVTQVRRPMDLPPGDYGLSVWESDTKVLFTATVGTRTYWIRCDSLSGTCEVATVLSVKDGLSDLALPAPG